MIKERYVNFEVARLLRDKGFDESCAGYYNPIGKLNFLTLTVTETNSGWADNVSAPTQQMACDWLIENHKIFIIVRFVSKIGYVGSVCDISNPDSTLYMLNTRPYPSIEAVYNEAIKYVLTNLV